VPRPTTLVLLLLALLLPASVPATSAGATSRDAREHVVVLSGDVGDVAEVADELLAPFGREPVWLYEHALRGFSAPLTAGEARALATSPLVASVEADRTFEVAGTTVPTGIARVGAVDPARRGVRIDADVAVLDTGLVAEHPDLRIHRRVDCTNPVESTSSQGWLSRLVTSGSRGERRLVCAPDSGDDRTGHGTHVAGVIGGEDDGDGVLGVAPGARLWGVKVLADGDGGATSRVVAGLDHVVEHADELEVVNLSFVSSGRSNAIDEAIATATERGLVVVAAAGNRGEPASWYTPANAPKAITVSAFTDLDGRPGGLARGECDGADDRFARYSNYGRAVDIAAPGSCILSTGLGGGTVRYSGTSVAAPHVAGAAARHLATDPSVRRSERWQHTRAVLLARAAPQTGRCGFAGGRSPEPLLRLRPC
jgi:subtilisin family serine protease